MCPWTNCKYGESESTHGWLRPVVAAAISAMLSVIITRHLGSPTSSAPPRSPDAAQAPNKRVTLADHCLTVKVDNEASETPTELMSQPDCEDTDQQARRAIIEKSLNEAPRLRDLPLAHLLNVAKRIEDQATCDSTQRKLARREQLVRISRSLFLVAALLTTVLPFTATVWVVITVIGNGGAFAASVPQHWPVLGLRSEMMATTLSALFAANAAINVALAVNFQSARRSDQVYDTVWKTDLTRVAGAAAFAAASVLVLFLVGGSERNPATVFLAFVLTALTMALAITCDQRENTITRTEHLHSARNTLSGLIVWQEHLHTRHVPTSYRGPWTPPKDDRYRTWPVLIAVTAMALICMGLFAVITLRAQPAIMLVTLCIGAVLSLGATWSFLFQTYVTWTTVTDVPERSLGRTPLLQKVFVIGLTVCAVLLSAFPEGRMAATVVIGIVAGPVIIFRAISRSLEPGHSRVVDFLAWPVWGRVGTELSRKQELLKQSASRRFIQELSPIEPAPPGERAPEHPDDRVRSGAPRS